MNPVFVFLVILAAVLVWMLCAGLFKYIGSVFGEMVDDVKNEMTKGEKKDDENE